MTYHKQYRYEIPRMGGLIVFFISILSIVGVVFLRSMLPPYIGDVFIILFIGSALLGLCLFFRYYYHIEITDQTITFKENFLSPKTTTLHYHQIKQLEKIEIYKIPALQFFFNKKKCIISSQGFNNIDDFNEIFAFLQNKVN